MSRIGKKPIILSEGVTVELKDRLLTVSGMKGGLSFEIKPQIEVKVVNGQILVSRKKDDTQTRALHGTTRQVIANMVKGVSEGWSKILEVVGTGYRASLQDEKLVLSLGFSHPVEVAPPSRISFSVSGNKITVSGIDKALVGQTAANIRSIRPPDPYKGKGIRYLGEKVKLKPGKAAKIGVGIPGPTER